MIVIMRVLIYSIGTNRTGKHQASSIFTSIGDYRLTINAIQCEYIDEY